MNRRSFLKAVTAAFAFTVSTAKAFAKYVDPRGWHRHQCPRCAYIWTHTTGSHNCPNTVNGCVCGTFQNIWYQGPLPPTAQGMVAQPLAKRPTETPSYKH